MNQQVNLDEITDQGKIATMIVQQERLMQVTQQNLQALNARYDQLGQAELAAEDDDDIVAKIANTKPKK